MAIGVRIHKEEKYLFDLISLYLILDKDAMSLEVECSLSIAASAVTPLRKIDDIVF
jgi:hypothetical protein